MDIEVIEAQSKRKSWDTYFLDMLPAIGARATCDRGKAACVITNKDHQILSTGYVGAPSGLPHCDDVGHLIEKTKHLGSAVLTEHCVRTIHAEQNAIVSAAKNGVSTNGATLYCTMTPCATCAMMIIAAGINRVVVDKVYGTANRTMKMFNTVGIELLTRTDEVVKYGRTDNE